MNVSFFAVQKQLLEQLFGDKWFVNNLARNKRHPAFKKWQFCREMIEKGGEISFPVIRDEFDQIASLMLDNYILAESSGGELSQFSLGDFKGFGDEKVQKRIQTIISDPKQFNSLMTELSLAAWCSSKDFLVTPYEEIGYPDFRLDIDGVNLPVVVECKNIEDGTTNNRFKNIVNKANKQIKNIGEDCYGVLFVDITALVERREELSDSLPESVEIIIEIFNDLLAHFNSSVSSAILFWDEYSIFGEEQDAERTTAFIRRRSYHVAHKNPKQCLPSDTPLLEYGNTIAFGVDRNPPKEIREMLYGSSSALNSVSRNSLCPCGSEKRFKHCCGSLA